MAKAKALTHLSRKDMEAKIAAGESVIHEGQMITTVEGLPTDVDLALGDPAKEASTEAEIDRQIKALEASKSQLRAGKKTDPVAPAKPSSFEPAKPVDDSDKSPEDKRAAILGGQTKPAK